AMHHFALLPEWSDCLFRKQPAMAVELFKGVWSVVSSQAVRRRGAISKETCWKRPRELSLCVCVH
ncbi:hypothetical protein LSAT2_001227, partial [Lamellibrachia satsuma]